MLYLNKKHLKEIISHVNESAPLEACGVLTGHQDIQDKLKIKREVTKVYRMTNTDKARESFLMDPREQLSLMKEIRTLGLEMVGIYHSHPETRAYPSAHDVEMAFYTDVSYVIISLADRENPVIKAFIIENGKILEEEIVYGENL